MRGTRLARLGLVAASAALLLWACGGSGSGGGGGGGAPTAEITPQSMADAISVMDTYVPGCSDGGAVSRALRTAPPTATGTTVKTVLQLLKKERVLRAARAAGLEDVRSGDCPGGGGTFTNDYTHASGTDTGSFVFDQYCTIDDDSGEETTIHGTFRYQDRGQPTDFGPERVKLTASTGGDGLRIQSSEGDDTTLKLNDFAYTVGTPGAPPTTAKPDVLTVGSLTTKDNTPGGHTEKISGFSMAMSGSGAQTEYVVRSGQLTTQDHGTVDLTTADGAPLVLDGNGDLVGGTLLVSGGAGDTAEFVVNPANPNEFEVSVDGTPLTTSLDCNEFFGGSFL